jgi:hypothetical protein
MGMSYNLNLLSLGYKISLNQFHKQGIIQDSLLLPQWKKIIRL